MQTQGHYVSSPNLGQGLAPTQLTPGGDFGWLRKNFQWQAKDGGQERSSGDRHGHNIVAADYGYSADAILRTAPGGSFQAANLSCTSCHDPHGRYRRDVNGTISTAGPAVVGSGSYTNSTNPDSNASVGTYRMLAGKGYQQKLSSGSAFITDPPAAVAPVNYNRSEAMTDTRVAYGSGMSEWCQNCHGNIHSSEGARSRQHPAGNNARLSADTTNNYNFYVASGNLTGRQDTAYTSMVPYEMGTDDFGVLKQVANSNGSNLSGPDGSGNVMCLSCHRAHASGWDSITRWNNQATLLVSNGRYPGIDNGASADDAQGRTEAETRKTFYDRPASRYALFQRSLCNKCHAKD
ncbi:cytochrome c [Geomonas limicola]|uniref:Cytochrome c n=1 Tax=Geomonas limicola TaxID=2740186 RepID=A0A6V8NAP7_9BACT|nr:cytochrome c [Geomonas limicola]